MRIDKDNTSSSPSDVDGESRYQQRKAFVPSHSVVSMCICNYNTVLIDL